MKENQPTSPHQIINEPLWCNEHITSSGKPIFFKNWYTANYKVVADVWDFDLKAFKSKEDLNNIYLLTDFQYSRLISALTKFQNQLLSSSANMLVTTPKIRNHFRFLLLTNATSKKLYDIFVRNNKRPAHEATVQSWFNSELNWDDIYTNAPRLTKNVYVLHVNFKINHNILPTNEKLFIWKRADRPHCICGVVDTNLHFIVQCKLIQVFWEKVMKFIESILDIRFPVTDKEIFFGIPNPLDTPDIDMINYIFLIAKTFIWSDKRLGRPCHVHDFILYLREQILIETSSKLFKVKPFLTQLAEQLL